MLTSQVKYHTKQEDAMNSSLKLGAYSRKERLHLVIRDYRCWKAVGYALLSGLTLASTAIMFTLALALCINGIPSNPSTYIFPMSVILIAGTFLSPGTFLEFLCAESEHSTIAEFSAESIQLDLKIIKKLNPWQIGIVLPFTLFISTYHKCKQGIYYLA
ncbi:MAG: hypothetical protein US70_C0005G0006 [Parcubacteria group bacterium GW2011_GWD2_38_11]|nr:MAG: hypothetical protein US70_C0005G0006 [Parcubacteria group bacterium GW2011_GWD2_38_11]